MNRDSRIFIAGTSTIAGKALASRLQLDYSNVQTDLSLRVDLQDGDQVQKSFEQFRPEYLFFMGASSLGIGANVKFPAELFTQNTRAALNLFETARLFRVQKVFYLASSCIYPMNAPQPMKPESLGTGPLEKTCESYAQAKIFAIDLAHAYEKQYGLQTVIGIPADTFGPEEDFHPEHSHVVGALIRKIYEAKIAGSPFVTLWGSGKPVRDFIYSKDLAEACIFWMQNAKSSNPCNLSAGNFMSILELAKKIAVCANYSGSFNYDFSKQDGAPIKTLDHSNITQAGWKPKHEFKQALLETYDSFISKETAARA